MSDLVLDTIHKAYGATKVIHGIDMEIASGEFCVFVGPSGCGKSTLLRMIAGLEEVTSGALRIDGEVVNDISAAQRGLAMVFQNYALYPHMSVRQNLSFGLENLSMDKAEVDQRVNDAATMLQIHDYLDRRPGQLSGGQRQRVAIGRAVVREPRVFLFDEPLSNLDAELRVAMRIEISDLHARLGNTMIYVTHDQVEAMTMADKIAVLRAGKLEQFGKPLDIFNAPANRFVAGFIGSPAMNFADGVIEGDHLKLATGETLPIPEGRFDISPGVINVHVGFRPNHIDVSDTEGGDSLVMTVDEVEQLGSESYLYGKLTDGSAITVHRPGQIQTGRGDTIHITPHTPELHLFDRATGATLRK